MNYEFILTFGISVLEIIMYIFISVVIITTYRYTNWEIGLYKRVRIMILTAIITLTSFAIVTDLKKIVYKETCSNLKGQSKIIDCNKYNGQKDIEENEKN